MKINHEKIRKILIMNIKKLTSENSLGAECSMTINKAALVRLVSSVNSEMSFEDTLLIEGS
jgi:hypothetical protein